MWPTAQERPGGAGATLANRRPRAFCVVVSLRTTRKISFGFIVLQQPGKRGRAVGSHTGFHH